MKFYETLYIIHPILEQGRLKDAIQNVEKYLEKNNKNKILYIDYWGKKKLAYPIEKQKYGNYVLIQFSGDGQKQKEFNLDMEQNPNILSHMTTLITKKEILEQKENIDVQISGQEKLDKTENSSLKSEQEKQEEASEKKEILEEKEKQEKQEEASEKKEILEEKEKQEKQEEQINNIKEDENNTKSE